MVRALSLGELVPTCAVDVDSFLEERDVEGLLVKLGEESLGRVAPVAHLGEALSEGEPEQVSGLREGAQSELVEAAALDERKEDAVAV